MFGRRFDMEGKPLELLFLVPCVIGKLIVEAVQRRKAEKYANERVRWK